MGVLSAEELAYARILSRLFVRLDTVNYSADALQSHIKTYLGNIGFSPVVNAKNRDEYINNIKSGIKYVVKELPEGQSNEKIKKEPTIVDRLFDIVGEEYIEFK